MESDALTTYQFSLLLYSRPFSQDRNSRRTELAEKRQRCAAVVRFPLGWMSADTCRQDDTLPVISCARRFTRRPTIWTHLRP